MGTPEAESIWQPKDFTTQRWGASEWDRRESQFVEESGAKLYSFFDSPKGAEFLNWMSTEEGRQYKEALGRAIRGE